MSNPHYPADLVARVQSIIDQDPREVGPLTKWGQILDKLKEHSIPYIVEDVSATLVLVHPDNRSKLGVNAFNAHRNGAFIKRMGADLQELLKATAFEICGVEPKRTEQIEFNRRLVDAAAGMLAPINGAERYVSVGCGHTAAFVRAALASCVTPQPSIADGSGHLNVQHICKGDGKLKRMIERGWSWTILPWQVEMTWPMLPDLAQRALNASNSVASQSSELETAASIAEFAQLQGFSGNPIDWDQCAQAAAASMPPCANYCSTLATYVKLYGGGPGAPIVKYLDEFSKAFGENRRLGEEFIKSITELQFQSLSKLYPHVRTGLIATNLVSPKVIDGFARLLVKADVDRLKSKDRAAFIDSCEVTMSHGWELITDLQKRSLLSPSKATMIMGRLHTRTTLHMTGKAKLGFEGKDYPNLEAIQKCFIDDLKAQLPAATEIVSDWVKKENVTQTCDASASSQPTASATDAAVDIATLSDPAWVARNSGFAIGKLYYEKSVGSSKGLYILESLAGGSVAIKEYNLGRGPARKASYSIDDFMKMAGVQGGAAHQH